MAGNKEAARVGRLLEQELGVLQHDLRRYLGESNAVHVIVFT